MKSRRGTGPGTGGRKGATRISDADRALWDALTRDAKPLRRSALPRPAAVAEAPGLPAAPPSPEPVAKPAAGPAPRIAVAKMVKPAPLVVGVRAPGMDDTGWAMLTQGRVVRWRKLDLHGRTVQAAYVVLHDFLERAHREGVRHVEIVTGLGSGPEGGAIRRELPHWLNAPSLRRLLLGAAHPHPRNPGAVRVLLRRSRR